MHHNPTADDRTWYGFVAAKGDDPAEILIYDYIGSFGVSASNFDRDLKAIGKPASGKATMRINSPGGDTPTAASIYNMLERWVAKNNVELTVVIDGVAASAASWIAMLGDDIVMPENTLMMIHDPAGIVMGTSREMRSLAAVLDRIKQGMVSAYMKKSGQSKEDVEAIMEAETWYSAQEAVDAGFADRVDNPVNIAASFDLTRFKNPPTEWAEENLPGGPAVARVAADTKEKVTMTTKPNQQETAAEMETRIRAELAAESTAASAAAAAASAAAAAQETPANIEARVRKEIADTNTEITALCTMAGKPNLAAEFIAQGKTVAEVRTALTATAGTTAAAPAQQQANMNTRQQQSAAQGGGDHKELVASGIDSTKVFANYRKGKGTPINVAA